MHLHLLEVLEFPLRRFDYSASLTLALRAVALFRVARTVGDLGDVGHLFSRRI